MVKRVRKQMKITSLNLGKFEFHTRNEVREALYQRGAIMCHGIVRKGSHFLPPSRCTFSFTSDCHCHCLVHRLIGFKIDEYASNPITGV